MDPGIITVQYRTLNIQIHQDLYTILNDYHVHFFARGHICAEEGDQAAVHFFGVGSMFQLRLHILKITYFAWNYFIFQKIIHSYCFLA